MVPGINWVRGEEEKKIRKGEREGSEDVTFVDFGL